MANNCWNNIEVSPLSDDVNNKNFKKFIAKIVFIREELGNEGNIFEYLIGKAPDDVDLVTLYGCSPIYSVDDFLSQVDEHNIGDTFFCSGFESRWSPPVGFCRLLSEMYQVCVKITFDEGGNDFSGNSQFTNGETDFDETWAYLEGIYNMDTDWFWNEMNSQIEYYIEDEVEIVEFLEDYHFLSKEDFEKLRTHYTKEQNDVLKNN